MLGPQHGPQHGPLYLGPNMPKTYLRDNTLQVP